MKITISDFTISVSITLMLALHLTVRTSKYVKQDVVLKRILSNIRPNFQYLSKDQYLLSTLLHNDTVQNCSNNLTVLHKCNKGSFLNTIENYKLYSDFKRIPKHV